MKTTNKHHRTSKMVTVLCAALVLGTSVFAQPNANATRSEEVSEAFERLEAMMCCAEQAAKYVAPAADYDEIQSAWGRLELMANKIVVEIRYQVPNEEQANAMDFLVEESSRENETGDAIAYNTAYVTKLNGKK